MKNVGNLELLVSTTIGGHPVYDENGLPALITADLSRFRHLLKGQVLICSKYAYGAIRMWIKDPQECLLVAHETDDLSSLLVAARQAGTKQIFVLAAPALTQDVLKHADLKALHISQYFARVPDATCEVDTTIRLHDHSLTFDGYRQTGSDWETLDFRVGPTWGQNRHSVWTRA